MGTKVGTVAGVMPAADKCRRKSQVGEIVILSLPPSFGVMNRGEGWETLPRGGHTSQGIAKGAMSNSRTDPTFQHVCDEARSEYKLGFTLWFNAAQQERNIIYSYLPHLDQGEQLTSKLAELCLSEARSRLTAFAELLKRQEVPHEKAIDELQLHGWEVLDEMYEEWSIGIRAISLNDDEFNTWMMRFSYDQYGAFSEQILAMARHELQGNLIQPGASVEPSKASEQRSVASIRREMVDRKLDTLSRETGRKWKRVHIWRMDGYDDGRTFQYWQNGHVKGNGITKWMNRFFRMSSKEALEFLENAEKLASVA